MKDIITNLNPEFEQRLRDFGIACLASKKALYLIGRHQDLTLNKEEMDKLLYEHCKATLDADNCFRSMVLQGIPVQILPEQLLIDVATNVHNKPIQSKE
jgi:hypothetical protein